jgi:2',3'-cyclic-nucleotide 2'-phosphodiesterase (5'-nucleotidase family)
VCANLQYFAGSKWQQPKSLLTVTIGNTTIGITAVIDNDAFKYYPNEIISKIKIGNPNEALEKVITNLNNNFIVVLSHLGFEKDKEIALKFPQIGLIVGGHSQTLVKKPVKVGNTLIVQAGPNGSRIGVLRAIVTGKYISSYEHSFVLPKWEDPDDPAIEKMITEYNEENAKRFPR